jgi:DNA-directed RNA polymerase subunit RPC12/RpoP
MTKLADGDPAAAAWPFSARPPKPILAKRWGRPAACPHCGGRFLVEVTWNWLTCSDCGQSTPSQDAQHEPQ